jgi:signal transduction histidine kinase
MREFFRRAIDYFSPLEARGDQANLMKIRTFNLLHLIGPAMGHSVILFLWYASPQLTWQFWVIEASLVSFWLVPFLVKFTQSLIFPATFSVYLLVFLSLFGSFFYGGISSPFMPWFLIALLLGFFFLADHPARVVGGVVAQLAIFTAARLYVGDFQTLLPLSSMTSVNLISIVAAIAYTTLLSIYYETVMRDSGALEAATRAQRGQAEALHEAMRKAERASRQKSIFLAKISHELRTPLNAVIGYSEMLRDELSSESANKQRALDLERINAAGRHLLALVTDVLDLPSIEARRLEVSIKKVTISELLQDVTATAGPLIAKKHNRLMVQVVNDPGIIETDELKLRQAVLNLLSNSAKFTSHGVITLKVLTREQGASRRLIIEVRDTGIGMSQESLGRIFKDFSQAERDTTQKFGGTGLGLVLTERFCNMIGGTIHVQSQLGEGSVFTIDIPCSAVAA